MRSQPLRYHVSIPLSNTLCVLDGMLCWFFFNEKICLSICKSLQISSAEVSPLGILGTEGVQARTQDSDTIQLLTLALLSLHAGHFTAWSPNKTSDLIHAVDHQGQDKCSFGNYRFYTHEELFRNKVMERDVCCVCGQDFGETFVDSPYLSGDPQWDEDEVMLLFLGKLAQV